MADKKIPAHVPEDDPDDRYTVHEGDWLLVDKDGKPIPHPNEKLKREPQ